MKYYIYELHDPRTNSVFYVGMGTGNRAEKHFKYFNNNDFSFKSNVIRKIKQEGKIPVIKKVFFTDDRSQAEDKERELISYYGRRCDGTGPLTNIALGGDGGDTVTGVDNDSITRRYTKRANTLSKRTEEEKTKQYEKSAAAMKVAWDNHREEWRVNIKDGINKNRDKVAHASAVSAGWKNRSDQDKKKTAELKSSLRKEQWKDPIIRQNLLKGATAISIPVKITDNDGNEYLANSLAGWCKENNESYAVLWNILHGIGPKVNRYKRSKYLGWKVIDIRTI